MFRRPLKSLSLSLKARGSARIPGLLTMFSANKLAGVAQVMNFEDDLYSLENNIAVSCNICIWSKLAILEAPEKNKSDGKSPFNHAGFS